MSASSTHSIPRLCHGIDSLFQQRIHHLNQEDTHKGQYILYWMTAQRRVEYNYALEYAVHMANTLHKPLIIFEPLRCDYQWANDRFHAFVIEGMHNNHADTLETNATYIPYVEKQAGTLHSVCATLVEQASMVVCDMYPCFFLRSLPQKLANSLGAQFATKFVSIDGNGIFPISATPNEFTTAASFRRFLQKNIIPHLHRYPVEKPLSYLEHKLEIPYSIKAMLPTIEELSTYPIDHSVPKAQMLGGRHTAKAKFQHFLHHNLPQYHLDRNNIEKDPSSGLSPYLHFGHISSLEIVKNILEKYQWTSKQASPKAHGSREGWWNTAPEVEAFLDQIITWRELGFVFCHHVQNYMDYETLPSWAKITLAEHAEDPRPTIYTLEELECSQTHDAIWNAAQNQLRQTGMMHNYLRMLWGKKILEWSPSPEKALEILIHLNNKYALDGRDPNSYSGIFWTLGRFDHAWTERTIFGKIRYMTSDSTSKKMDVNAYVQQYTDSVQKFPKKKSTQLSLF